ncbi:MAG: cytidine deaminase [Clostridia bacterium]|nr:cytidine deaminase [Clostridia bacterium]
MTDVELIEKAKEAARASYSPYSGFTVGAALITKDGKLYLGCNIENASFSPTCCAERTAFFKAVSEGEREFSKIAIVGGKGLDFTDFCPPCGVCRQVMKEFCGEDFTVILGKNGEEVKTLTLGELLPFGFGL